MNGEYYVRLAPTFGCCVISSYGSLLVTITYTPGDTCFVTKLILIITCLPKHVHLLDIIYIYIYIYIYIRAYISILVCVCVYMRACTTYIICVYVYVYVSTCVYMYAFIYMCVCACVCVNIYTTSPIQSRRYCRTRGG